MVEQIVSQVFLPIPIRLTIGIIDVTVTDGLQTRIQYQFATA